MYKWQMMKKKTNERAVLADALLMLTSLQGATFTHIDWQHKMSPWFWLAAAGPLCALRERARLARCPRWIFHLWIFSSVLWFFHTSVFDVHQHVKLLCCPIFSGHSLAFFFIYRCFPLVPWFFLEYQLCCPSAHKISAFSINWDHTLCRALILLKHYLWLLGDNPGQGTTPTQFISKLVPILRRMTGKVNPTWY